MLLLLLQQAISKQLFWFLLKATQIEVKFMSTRTSVG